MSDIDPPAGPASNQPLPSTDPIERIRQLEKDLEGARAEAARYRTRTRDEAMPAALAEAARRTAKGLGVDLPADHAVDLDAVLAAHSRARDGERQELRRLKVDLGLARGFAKHGLKESVARAFMIDSGAMGRLNPDAPDFDQVVEDTVEEVAVQAPELRMLTPATKSGGEFRGQPPSGQLSREDLAALTPEQVASALRSGHLNELLGRRS